MNDNENLNQVNGQDGTDNDLDLLEEIKSLKANSVSKEEYNKLQEKNKTLMRQIINGGGTSGESEETVDLEELRNKIFGNPEDMTDLDFWKNTLALRNERLKEGVDIFLPKGKRTRYSNFDKESANHVAQVIEQLIQDSEGSPQVFKALLNNAIEN
jgi:hypothetical protein